jgi:hypothetical protein
MSLDGREYWNWEFLLPDSNSSSESVVVFTRAQLRLFKGSKDPSKIIDMQQEFLSGLLTEADLRCLIPFTGIESL